MLRNFNIHAIGDWRTPDICIVGAGAAGITIARQLAGSGLRVLLLESGGPEYSSRAQDLAAGDNVGFDYYELKHARLRFFGGTTAIWGGRCAELDEIDFEKRDWVPHSGWPIGKSDLARFYAKARAALGLPQVSGNHLPAGEPEPIERDARIEAAYWQFDDRFDRFTLRHCRDLRDNDKIGILLNATLTSIHLNAGRNAVDRLVISNHHGRQEIVRPGQLVLAAGGLENARLLLASDVGTEHDQVGRYFMEHPQARGSHVIPVDATQFSARFRNYTTHDKVRYGLLFRPSAEEQARTGSLNASFSLRPARAPGRQPELHTRLYTRMREQLQPTRFGRTLWSLVKRGSRIAQSHLLPHLISGRLKLGADGVYTVIRAEQAPNPASRVTLSDTADAQGVRRIQLDWQLSALDKHSARQAMLAFDHELQRTGVARTQLSDWLADDGPVWEHDPLISNHAKGGFHHMGTTRMGSDPKSSVVDANCQVHGVANLFVAGSSVFATSGWANPTLTILALSIRLAETLQGRATRTSPIDVTRLAPPALTFPIGTAARTTG